MNREVSQGNKRVIDTYSVILSSHEPLVIVYDKGSAKEIKLIFNFNLIESAENERVGIRLNPIDDSAQFEIDIIKGRSGIMPEMTSFAESEESVLSILPSFKAGKSGTFTFSYTLFMEDRTPDIPKAAKSKPRQKKRS